MKAQLIKTNIHQQSSFNINCYNSPTFSDTWKFHIGYELIAMQRISGKQFIGDNIDKFGPETLLLIGPRIPHMWKPEKKYNTQKFEFGTNVVAVHFSKNFAGEYFLGLQETQEIRHILKEGKQGIKFTGHRKNQTIEDVKKLSMLDGTEKLSLFISILGRLHKLEYHYLCTQGFIQSFQGSDDERLNQVIKYVMQHYTRKIKLHEVADLVNMTTTSFCRYFKNHTHKTFTRFVNEIRVGYACKLLVKNNMTIAQICYECGFNNLSNFNQQFKNIKEQTPSQYQQQFIN